MASLIPVLLVGLCSAVALAELPEGYILVVNPSCGGLNAKGAEVDIVTDLQIQAFAECNGTIEPFVTKDNVHYRLRVGYPKLGPHPCLFKKQDDAYSYSVKVVVSFRDIGGMMRQENEEFIVTCKFDPSKANGTDRTLGEGSITPVEKPPAKSADSTSISLRVMDGWGEDLTRQRVPIGRRAMLEATATASSATVKGLRPVSCVATGKGERYSIIRKGCGDGIVFSRTAGFTTEGLASTSPYFDAFRFHDGDDVQFECNFTICTTNCDGNSCQPEAERRRRSEQTSGKIVKAAQTKIFVEQVVTLPNETLGKVVFVKKARQDEPAAPTLTNPYFLIPVAVLGVLALVSFLIACCACARRDSAQIYEVNKGKVLETYDTPITIMARKMKRQSCGNRKCNCSPCCKCTLQTNCGCLTGSCGCVTGSCGCVTGIPGKVVCDSGCNKDLCKTLDICDSLYKDPWTTKLCDGDCVKPCDTKSGGKCDETCDNICNK